MSVLPSHRGSMKEQVRYLVHSLSAHACVPAGARRLFAPNVVGNTYNPYATNNNNNAQVTPISTTTGGSGSGTSGIQQTAATPAAPTTDASAAAGPDAPAQPPPSEHKVSLVTWNSGSSLSG